MMASHRKRLAAAWAVAIVATSGSLFYQFGLGLVPCELCWIQRILMYPLVVSLGYGVLVGQPDLHRLVLPLALPGLVVSAYHSWLQATTGLTCGFGGCGVVQARVLGLTIPNQALLAFTLITALLSVSWWDFRA